MRTQSEHCVSASGERVESASRKWVLKRNCSASPRQLAMAYAFLCAGSLAVAAFFALRGAWYVLGFAILELSAVGWAFFVFARHASDRDQLELVGKMLVIEVIRKEQSQRFRFDAQGLSVRLSPSGRFILVGTGEGALEVGGFLTERKRRDMANELRAALASVG